jgi:O-antigen/teichoic acid export membrane protein
MPPRRAAASPGHSLIDYVLGRGVAAAMGVLVVVVLVRAMSVEEYAAYAGVSGFVGLVGVLSLLGLDRVASRYIPEGVLKGGALDLQRFVRRLIGIRLAATAVLVLAVLLLAGPVSRLLNIAPDSPLFFAMCVCCLTNTLFDSGVLAGQGLMLQKQLRQAMTAQWVTRTAAIVAVAVWIKNVDAALIIAIYAATDLLGVLWMSAGVLTPSASVRADPQASGPWPADYRPIVALAARNQLNYLITVPWQGSTLRVVASAVLSPQDAAAFGFFQLLTDRIRMYLPVQFFQGLMEPVLARRLVSSGERGRVDRPILGVIRLSWWCLVPALAWSVCFGPPLLGWVTRGKFVDELRAFDLMLLQLLFVAASTGLWSIVNTVKLGRGTWLPPLISTILLFPLIPYFSRAAGVEGLAALCAASALLQTTMLVRLAEIDLPAMARELRILGKIVAIAVVSFGPGWLAVSLLDISETFTIAAVSVLSVLVFLLISHWFPPLSQDEMDSLCERYPKLALLFRPQRKAGQPGA